MFHFRWGCDRLWQDAQNRVGMIKELDRITGQVSLCFVYYYYYYLAIFLFGIYVDGYGHFLLSVK